ncbi:MAG: hypothetical protein IPK66_14260 [Rhodospirillales bacterium]|nr:hypothetical protein [Rhodospirillales bacterium]
MSELSSDGDRRALEVAVGETVRNGGALSALLRREIALLKAGRYHEIGALNGEKESLLRSLAHHAPALRDAGRDGILSLADGPTLITCLKELDEATGAELKALRGAIQASDRIAQIIGGAVARARPLGYGRDGSRGTGPSGALTINDDI